MNYRSFANTVIDFLFVAFAVFLLMRTVNRLKRQQVVPPATSTTKDCPFCQSAIPLTASRCPTAPPTPMLSLARLDHDSAAKALPKARAHGKAIGMPGRAAHF